MNSLGCVLIGFLAINRSCKSLVFPCQVGDLSPVLILKTMKREMDGKARKLTFRCYIVFEQQGRPSWKDQILVVDVTDISTSLTKRLDYDG